ncbi:MAG: phage tail protein [Cyanobacteriota bacterium]|jgi:phage tail-like protein|nr:phage tail protein [Cyanobacteriota bacterium]
MPSLTGFNFRVLFSPLVAENLLFDAASDALAAGGLQSAAIAGSATIQAGFAEVHGLNSELEMENVYEGGRNLGPRRFPRHGRFPNLVLRRGVTTDTALWDWWGDVIGRSYGLPAPGVPTPRRNGVILLDGLNHQAAAAWFFSNALPERLSGPVLNARTNEIAFETLELSHEGLLRLQQPPAGV